MSADASIGTEDSGTGRIARKAVVGLTALLIILLLAGAATTLWHRYLDTIGDARTSTANLATVLDEHAQRTLRVVEATLEGLVDRFQTEGYLVQPDADRVIRTLASRASVTSEVLNLFLIDTNGRSIADASGNREPFDLNQRSYVTFHRENARRGIHVSDPVTSLAGRGRVIIVSHRLSHPDGSFAGILGASVSTEYFEAFYRTIDVGRQGVITLRTHSGAIVARYPANEASLKGQADAGSRVAGAATGGRSSGTDDYVGRNDGIRRITSFRTVAGSSYIVSVGRAHSDFLAPWWTDVQRYGAATLALVLAILATCWFLLRQMSARETAVAARRAGERAATEAVKQSEAQEHRTRERLETILNRMPLGCMMADADLRMVYWNPAAEAIFATRFEDVKGLTPFETGLILEDQAAVEAMHEELRRGEMRGRSVARNLTKDGRKILCEWINTPLIGADGSFQGAISLVQDITERSANEEALRQSSKMDALGQLTGGVAHDFNNLLTVIMANVELVEEAVADRPEDMASLQAALGAAIRGADLTRQLLAFSRRQTLEPRVVEINALVKGMVGLLSRTIGENIETSLKASPDVWAVKIDPTQLETALANLVVNARDAMPAGGRLIIETENAPLDDEYAARHAEVTAGDYVALSVSDTGTGMTREVIERVFEPFFTTKEVGKGTGLGMSMVFGFVKQSGGHIKIYSEVGLGTTIRLYLPRAIEAIADADLPADPAPAPAKGGEVVLVVEDDAAVRESVVRNLARFGYRTLDAENAEVALEILDRGERIDLLFTDMVMPGAMNGAELALRARERRPDLKILLTSGYTAPALASRMREIDGAGILSKPYRIADLAREVRRIIDHV